MWQKIKDYAKQSLRAVRERAGEKGFAVKTAGIALFLSFSLLAAGFLAYVHTGTLVEYEVLAENRETAADAPVPVAASERAYVPEEIPVRAHYVLRLAEGTLCVYDETGGELYRTEELTFSMLSADDRKALEKEGIPLESRAELLEILSYMRS